MIKYSVKCLLQGHYTAKKFAPAAGCIQCSIQREILSQVKAFANINGVKNRRESPKIFYEVLGVKIRREAAKFF